MISDFAPKVTEQSKALRNICCVTLFFGVNIHQTAGLEFSICPNADNEYCTFLWTITLVTIVVVLCVDCFAEKYTICINKQTLNFVKVLSSNKPFDEWFANRLS